MPSLLEVWESRLGIAEVAGAKHNQIILDWCKAVGWESIKDDETAWCSTSMNAACLEAGLPMTPHNQRPMARSFLTWGKTVDPMDVQPGDIVVWPRGKSDWQGHVNCVAEVKKLKTTVKVRCIGGNQSLKGTNGAVTKTDWVDIKGALPNGVRRAVPATVKDLRDAGSTTIQRNDNLEKVGILTTFFTPIFEGIRTFVNSMFGPVDVPQFATLPEGLTWWQSVLGGVNGVLNYAAEHPFMAAVVVAGLGMWTISTMGKRARVAEHAAGIPIAREVAAAGAA